MYICMYVHIAYINMNIHICAKYVCVHAYTHTYVCVYIQIRLFGEEHELVAKSLHNLADALSKTGNCPEALKHYQRSQEIMMRHKSANVFSIVTLYSKYTRALTSENV